MMSKAAGLEYEDRGEGDVIFLIHGGVFADAFAALSRCAPVADGHRVVWYRRRGYGGSDPLAEPCSAADHARDAAELMREIGIARAHVVGHSGGGAVAVRLALDAADLVHSLVLLEPAIFTPDEAAVVEERFRPLLSTYRSGQPGKAIHIFMKVAGGDQWRADIEAHIPDAAAHAERDAAGLFEGDVARSHESVYGPEDAGRIVQPVLYLSGSRSGTQGRAAIRILAPQLREAVVPDVNHSLQMVAPMPIAEMIADFINDHPLPSTSSPPT
jgi:pimeloyl-ACP methyl ester carboxylesterase